MVDAVLFDFDGTLADTAPDLGGALNLLLQRYDKPTVPLARSRPFVSMGARGMLDIGFGLKPQHAEYEALKTEYLTLYEDNLFCATCLFDGMDILLDTLDQRAIPWGIVTNKHSRFTLPILAALKLDGRAKSVVCGDAVPQPKPHPAGLIAAAREINIPATKNIFYIGDDERDIHAAIAANMTPVVASYGYMGNGNPPTKWGTDLVIDSPLDLLSLFDRS
jgi:N-acetyl-D-muramate 6-phosphate phosphatase